MPGVKGRSGGARLGAGRKPVEQPKPQLPDPTRMGAQVAAGVLEAIEEERNLIEVLKEARANDRWLWWNIVKELQHQARGKPSQAHVLMMHSPVQLDTPEVLSLPDVDSRIEELLVRISVEARKSGSKGRVIEVAGTEKATPNQKQNRHLLSGKGTASA